MGRNNQIRGIRLIIIICLTFSLITCSTDVEPVAKLEAIPSDNVSVGEEFILDATDSVFDDVDWYLDGVPLGACNGNHVCRQTLNTVGSYTYRIKVKKEPSGGAMLTSPVTKKANKSIVITVTSTSTSTGSLDTSGSSSDLSPPSSPSIKINNGDTSTSVLGVTLSLSANDDVGVTGYYVSEGGDTPVATNSDWVDKTSSTSYSGSVVYTLNENGSKKVYAWFKDAAGNVSERTSDDIEYSRGTSIGIGSNHSCAVLKTGTIKCWGEGSDGQLGYGGNTDLKNPVAVYGISTATQVSSGGKHSCAVLSSKSVQCWGKGTAGQLGNSENSASSVPVSVTGISDAIQVVAGNEHSCVLLSTGNVKCWGKGTAGQLGNNASINQSAPVLVTGISSATYIAAGNEHSCAVTETENIECWGEGSAGQLGNGTEDSNTPLNVGNIANATKVALGDSHSCALLATGSVMCWGTDTNGQIGDGGDSTDSSTPASVSTIGTAAYIGAGADHTCVSLSSKTVYCWGKNTSGQLGLGNTTQQNSPSQISSLTSQTMIEGGSAHTCSVTSDGVMKCWGVGSSGQLGNDAITQQTSPVLVQGL